MSDLLDRIQEIFAADYTVESEMARGGMSRLFLARDRVLGRQVVIKILPPDFSTETAIARFKREAELTARLQHPHILPVISAGVHGDLLYYIMPFVAGESLRARLDREGKIASGEAVMLLAEVADALGYAHAQGIVHRDIKPENILLQGTHAVVADFGIAAALAAQPSSNDSNDRLTFTGMSLGTVGYMAPEQAVGERDIDARADVYALGVVGYEMIAGRPPFVGDSPQALVAAHLTLAPPPLEQFAPDVPTSVALTIDRALEKRREDRYDNGSHFRNALRASVPVMRTVTRVPARIAALRRNPKYVARAVAVAAIVLAVVATGIFALRSRARPVGADVITVAVAPFTVFGDDPALGLWHQGMVDVVARNLDGAGPIRAVPPNVVARANAVTTSANAQALAQSTHAQYTVWGTITPTIGDSVRLRGELVDASGVVLTSFERRGASIERLSDSLTLHVLSELSKHHRIAAASRPTPLSARSVRALRAFLQGEQFYRRTIFDSAVVMYTRSLAADSTFPLPLYRIASIESWRNSVDDSITRRFALRAGALNHGLSTRDSLVIVGDSITAAVTTPNTPVSWPLLTRLFTTLEGATTRYPEDAEIWYDLGEAREHLGFGRALHVTTANVLDAFDHSIALDSAFAPAYVHCVELALILRGPADAQRYADKYLSLAPSEKEAMGIGLVRRLLDPASANSAATQHVLDTIPPAGLRTAIYATLRWTDTAATALRLLRVLDRRARSESRSEPKRAQDSLVVAVYTPFELAYRGRFREAYALVGNTPSRLLTELALLGGVPADSVNPVFDGWLRQDLPIRRYLLPWWGARRDTSSLRAFEKSAGSKAGGLTGPYDVEAAHAYFALATADTAAALRGFAILSDTMCRDCYPDRLVEARVRAARGELALADTLLSSRPYTAISPLEIPIALENAHVAERLNDRKRAAREYARVVAAWSSGDPAAAPAVNDARAGLERLNPRTVTAVSARP